MWGGRELGKELGKELGREDPPSGNTETINSLACIHQTRKLDLVKLDQFRISPAYHPLL